MVWKESYKRFLNNNRKDLADKLTLQGYFLHNLFQAKVISDLHYEDVKNKLQNESRRRAVERLLDILLDAREDEDFQYFCKILWDDEDEKAAGGILVSLEEEDKLQILKPTTAAEGDKPPPAAEGDKPPPAAERDEPPPGKVVVLQKSYGDFLIKNREGITSKLLFTGQLLNRLMEKNVLTRIQYDQVKDTEKRESIRKAGEVLLDIISNTTDKEFECFCKILSADEDESGAAESLNNLARGDSNHIFGKE